MFATDNALSVLATESDLIREMSFEKVPKEFKRWLRMAAFVSD